MFPGSFQVRESMWHCQKCSAFKDTLARVNLNQLMTTKFHSVNQPYASILIHHASKDYNEQKC